MTQPLSSCQMSCERATVALVTAMVLGVSEGVWILARWGAVVPGAWAKFLLLLAVLLCYTTLAALLAPIEAATAPLVGCLSKLLGGKDRWADRLWSVGIVSSVVLLWIVRPHHVDPILDFIMFTIDAVWGEGAAPESRVLPLLIFCLVVLASLWSSSALFRRYGQPGARGRLLVVVGAIGTGQWLLWYQASHNENQYPYIHGLMCIAAFMSLRQAVNAALGGRAIRSSRVWIMGWLALIGSGVSLNFMLDNSRATEARLMFNSDGARSVVFFLRSLWDDDGDGYSPHFGGDDTDDRNPNVHPGNRERPGDGMDNDGWGGDCPDGSLADNAHRSLAKPQFTLSRPMRRILCISVDALRMDAMDHAPMLSVLSRNHVSFTSARASGALTMTSYWSFLRGLTPRLFSISDQSTFVESLRHSNIPTAAVLCDFFPREFVFDRSYGDISGDDTSPSSASTTATLQAWSFSKMVL